MGKASINKAVILSLLISITVFISRHISYSSEFWNIIFLMVIIFIEAFAVDKFIDIINKKRK